MPPFRLGHGLYTADLNSDEGKKLMKELVDTKGVLEFQLTSNVRLNNLTDLERHPLKQYLAAGVRCVQGTDGCGFYGSDTMDEQLALHNLIGLSDEDFAMLATVVNCEANRSSKDDILGVVSVILNRADSSRYPNDPVAVVAAPHQFSCYKGVINHNVSDFVKAVVRDALNGIRNNKYLGFRSWWSTNYSDKYVISGGNRYGYN
jgi:hypothetical protein